MIRSNEQIIKEVQAKAIKIGHCLCNLKLKCPCIDFLENKVCKCSEHFIKNNLNK